MVDCWGSECDANPAIKKEISAVFSSPASQFSQNKTSEDYCGLDFDLVVTSFPKLSENKSVISEIVKVVQQTLLSSLKPNPTGVEALRVYLLLPELIRHLQKQQRTELSEELASKILQLDPDSRTVLETYWSKLPDDCLKSVVDLYKKESAELIDRIYLQDINWDIPRLLQTFFIWSISVLDRVRESVLSGYEYSNDDSETPVQVYSGPSTTGPHLLCSVGSVFESKKTLKAKVIEAINHKRGFWEE